ncbi:ParB/RepB/Spo0J family partition protein [Bradyrhizobium sp. 613_E4_N2_2]|uniref:ParB/RepB/Spo0J family partition protein n=1 Tax=Bradyrhizobium sp. 613_E4_N2_2 TaxID=3240371 RepID=UPI003F8A1308
MTLTFKQMIQSGDIKRADAMKARLEEIHEEPGFNLRIEGEDLEASIEALTDYIVAGGIVPPLEVRPRSAGGVWIVDGHRRTRAFRRAVEKHGAPIEWVSITAFTGNDVDRVTRIMTSAEGRSLSPLETADGYKRLASFGLSPEDIGKRVGKTRPHVEALLLLANANFDVRDLVRAGTVAASTAIDMVRKHGEEAGAIIVAKANGRTKVSATDVKGKPLPRKVVDDVVGRVEAFADGIPKHARALIYGGSPAEDATVELPVSIVRSLVEAHTSIADARDKAEQKAREKAARAAQTELPA